MPSEAEIEAAARAMFLNYNPGSDPYGAPHAAWRIFEDNARAALEAAEKVRSDELMRAGFLSETAPVSQEAWDKLRSLARRHVGQ